MKTLKLVALISTICLIAGPSQAQIFKNLKEKVSRSVERAVTDKVAEKAAKEASKTMDAILNPDFVTKSPITFGTYRGDMEKVPDSYTFDWSYRIKIEMPKTKDNMEFEYRLNENGTYWGAQFDHNDMKNGMNIFTVFDYDIEQNVMFMQSEEMNMVTATRLDTSSAENEEEEYRTSSYTIDKIDGKTILGYNCDGFIMENDYHHITMYITFEADVGFGDIYDTNQKFPKNFDPDWLKDGDKQGLAMEMEFKDKKDNKNDMRMTCVKLEKEAFSISKNDYQLY